MREWPAIPVLRAPRLLPLLLLFLLCVSLCSASHYVIYARAALTLAQHFALDQVATVVSQTPSNSLWLTPEDANLTTVSQAVSSAFLLKRAADDPSQLVVIDHLKPAQKSTTASWGIDRVDQRTLPLNHIYAPDRTGAGTTIWIVDTGIDASHADFGGRASNLFSTYNPPTDCDGHGTHVAGTAGGATFGIAHAATLNGIKVLDCNGAGTTLTVAQGLQYVLNNLAPSRNVINMSFGYGARDSVIEALLLDLYNSDVTLVAAAGNSAGSACNSFPAAHTTVIAAASSTIGDARSSFSNFGSCVALFAPGSDIVSARLGGGSTTLSGTSMASPHVAGAAALAVQSVALNPAAVRANLVGRATQGVLTNVNGSPNLLLFALQSTNPPQPGSTTSSTTTTSSSSSSSSSSSTTTSSAAAGIRPDWMVGVLVMAVAACLALK